VACALEGSEFELPVPVSKLSDDGIMLEFATARRTVNTGVKVHRRIAVKIHQPEEDGCGVWFWKGEREGDYPSPCH
jgi:hypothetical protein